MRARDAAAPALQPKPHVGLLLPLHPVPPATRVGGVDVAATATRAAGRAVGERQWEPERDVTLRWLFSFPFFHLSGLASASLSPHLRLPVHVTLRGFFPPSPSFLPVSSPFYSVGSSLCGRPAVLVQEGRKEGIFAEFVGSGLVQVLGECGHCLIGDIRWGLSPVSSTPVPAVLPVKIL